MEWSLRCDRCWLFAWSSSVMSLASSLSQGSKMNEMAAWNSWVYKLWGLEVKCVMEEPVVEWKHLEPGVAKR